MDKLANIYKEQLSKTSTISEVYTLLNFIQALTVLHVISHWDYSERAIAKQFNVSHQTINNWVKKFQLRFPVSETNP